MLYEVITLNPDPSATVEDTIKIDKVVNNFLLEHFEQYSDYYRFKVDKPDDKQHDFFSHIVITSYSIHYTKLYEKFQ